LETETFNVLAAPLPQELLAAAEIKPLLLPTVAVIEVEVEEPLHPEGNVQV
jgi:hypothetical protein